MNVNIFYWQHQKKEFQNFVIVLVLKLIKNQEILLYLFQILILVFKLVLIQKQMKKKMKEAVLIEKITIDKFHAKILLEKLKQLLEENE